MDNADENRKRYELLVFPTKHSTKDKIQKIEVFITEDLQRITNKWSKKPVKPKTFIFNVLNPKDLS